MLALPKEVQLDQLPDDILREIFRACLPTDRNPRMSNKEAPVLFTHISRRIRYLLLETPSFWSRVHISLIHSAHLGDAREALTADASHRLRGVEEWLLRRSGSCPLNISVYEPYDHYGNLNEFAAPMFDILLRCAGRWKSVSFMGSANSFWRLATFPVETYRLLDSLSLKITESSYYPLRRYTAPIFRSPQLHKLKLLNIHLDHRTVNWSKLTVLTINSSADIIDILGFTRNLVSCTLHVTVDDITEFRGGSETIRLLSLQKLTVFESVHNSTPTTSVLSRLELPTLKSLQYFTDDVWYPSPLTDFLYRSGANVTELILDIPRMNQATLLIWLDICPSLITLNITSSESASRRFDTRWPSETLDRMLCLLVMVDDPRGLCNKLECLHINARPWAPSHEAIWSFIQRKQSGIESDSHVGSSALSRLKELSISFEHPAAFDIRARLTAPMLRDFKLVLDYKYRALYSSVDPNLTNI